MNADERRWLFWLKKIVAWCGYFYSGLILIYLILRIIFWDSFWLIGLIGTFIPLIFFPILLLPVIEFFTLKKRWFIIISSVACLLLIGWLHLKYFSPNSVSSNGSETSIKVLTLNSSWYKTSSENMVSLIQKEQPDIVFLQEIVRKHTQRALVWLKEVYPYQTTAPEVAILSKYPITSSEVLHLANHRDIQQRAIITINEKDIIVYNIQVKSPWINYYKILPFINIPFYDYRERSQEIQDLVQRLKKETLPVIVAGDFNMTDQSQDYNVLQTVLQDAFQSSGLGFGFTWPHGWELSFLVKNSPWKLNYPIFRIDYIWYSPHWRSRLTKVLPTTGSDHLPVKTELIAIATN